MSRPKRPASTVDFINSVGLTDGDMLSLSDAPQAVMINFNYNSRSERQFRFALELANIGSFGFGGEGQGLSVTR